MKSCGLWKENLNLKIVSLVGRKLWHIWCQTGRRRSKMPLSAAFVIVLKNSVTSISNSCHHLLLLVFVSPKCILHTIRILKGRHKLLWEWDWKNGLNILKQTYNCDFINRQTDKSIFLCLIYIYWTGNRSNYSSSSTFRSAWINNKQKIIKFGLQEAIFNGLWWTPSPSFHPFFLMRSNVCWSYQPQGKITTNTNLQLNPPTLLP